MSVSSVGKSSRSLEKQCLSVANHLIVQCKLQYVPPVHFISDINSNLIVSLFEKIANFQIPDLLSCTNKIEEAHNVQAVIDTLSLDLLGMSLSHITGEDVVSGNLVAICNLLEILHGLLNATSNTPSDRMKRMNLKRKISRKSSGWLSSEKQESTSKHPKSVAKTKPQEKVDRASLKQPRPLNSLSEQLHKNRPRRSSFRIKAKHNKNGHAVPSQKLSYESSTKSPPPKLQKRSDKKIAEGNNQSTEKEDMKSHVEDCNKKQCGEPRRRSQRHLKQKAKPHFQVETVGNKQKSTGPESKNTVPKKIKGNTNKPTSLENTVEDVTNEQDIEKLYEKNLEKKIRVIVEKNSYLRSRASHLKKWHLQAVRKPLQRTPISACKKSFLLPHTLRQRSISRTALKRIAANKVQPQHTKQKENDKNMPGTSKAGFIQELFEDFPALELPPTLVNHITNKYQKHLIKMHRKAKDCLLEVPKTQSQAKEAAKKQSAMSKVLQKDIRQQQYMKKFKENKENENKMKYYLRNARMQSAKMKQYSKEFQVEMRKKMQKRNFAEELIFEQVFEDALKLQKEQVDHLCKEVKETGERDARKHLIYLDALENLYQSQFSLMSETLASEKRDAEERVKAEKQAMGAMQREFQEELKEEIRFMQQAIIECTEDVQFRQMDANQYTEKLRKRLS